MVAIDTTEVPYFGTRDEWVHYSPTKKCYVHRYVVAAAINGPRKIPLFIRPISMFDSRADAMEAVLRDIEKLRLEVEGGYMDCGFFSVEVMEVLARRNIPFAIAARRTAGIRRVLEGLSGDGPHVVPYVVSAGDGGRQIRVDLVVYWRGGRRIVVVCRGMSLGNALEYWRRWGVETCNQMVKARRARTCSRSVALRWFLLLVSAVIYLSYVYLISRCDSAPASYTCFLGALVLHFFEFVVDRARPRLMFRICMVLLRVAPAVPYFGRPPVCVSPQGGRWCE
ncbi:MAG: hypothetical protein ACTSXX_12930 [Candidatus Baldrarchaeia archaeon]